MQRSYLPRFSDTHLPEGAEMFFARGATNEAHIRAFENNTAELMEFSHFPFLYRR